MTTSDQSSATITNNHDEQPTFGHFHLWALVLMIWLSFGLSTIANRIALDYILAGDLSGFATQTQDVIRQLSQGATELVSPEIVINYDTLPTNLQDLMWLVFGIWIAGYIAGFLIGLIGGQDDKNQGLIWSALAGFEAMLLLRLIFLDAFPATPQDAFQNVSNILLLQSVDGPVGFLFLTSLFGGLLVVLAVLTGNAVKRMTPFESFRLNLDPSLLLTSIFMPVILLIAFLGITFTLQALADQSEFTFYEWIDPLSSQFPAQAIIAAGMYEIFQLETLFSPATHMAIAAIVGILVAFNPQPLSLTDSLSNVAISGMLYVMLFVLSKDLLRIYAEPGLEDQISFVFPDVALFILLWLGTVMTMTTATFAVGNVRLLMLETNQR